LSFFASVAYIWYLYYFGASGNSVGGIGVEVEAAAVEVDRNFEMVPVAEAVGRLLEGLDLPGYALAHGVGDPMPEVGQDVRQVALDHLRALEHLRQPAPRRPAVPPLPLRLGRGAAATAPQIPQAFLERPGSCRLQPPPGPAARERREAFLVPLRHVLLPVPPDVLGTGQRAVALLAQEAMFLAPHPVHGGIHVLQNVEYVE